MSRTVSADAIKAVNSAQTDEVFLIILTLSHADLASDICVVNDLVDIVSNGVTYTAFPFSISLQGENPENLTNAQLRIDNVDRRIITALRSIDSPPTITLSVILSSSPDTVELGPVEFVLRNASYDSQAVSGELVYEERLDAHIPQHQFRPKWFPGLF